jgi:HEAT repeat protein
MLEEELTKDFSHPKATLSLVDPRAAASLLATMSAQARGGEQLAMFLISWTAKVGPAVVPSLQKLARHSAAHVRNQALSALAARGRRFSEEALVGALGDRDLEVVTTALNELAKLGSRRIDVLENSVAVLLNHNYPPGPRIAAAAFLGKVGRHPLPGKTSTEEILVKCLEQQPHGLKARLFSRKNVELDVQIALCHALSQLGTQTAVSTLSRFTGHKHKPLAEAASQAVAAIRARDPAAN